MTQTQNNILSAAVSGGLHCIQATDVNCANKRQKLYINQTRKLQLDLCQTYSQDSSEDKKLVC